MLTDLWFGILDLVYPPHCCLCKKPLEHHSESPPEGLCPECLSLILTNTPPFCLRCSRHLETPDQSSYCHICQRHEHIFDFAWCACLYTPPMSDLIHRFKYSDQTFLQFLFSRLLINFIINNQLDIYQFDYLIPLPLSATRTRERGYNQSELLARHIARHFNLPLETKILRKSRHCRPQVSLSEKDRWTNIRGAFTIKNSKTLQNKSVLIIDDLLTTGASASEAAGILKASGAATVGILTLAVTPEMRRSCEKHHEVRRWSPMD